MFKMIDEIAMGRTDKVFYMYRELLELQINVNVILANLRTHFKQLLEVKLSDRAPRSEVISKTRMQPFLYGSYVGQAERFSYTTLRVMLEKVCDYEYKFKTGQISDVLGLEILIIELLGIKKEN